jgi:hypothetical protein
LNFAGFYKTNICLDRNNHRVIIIFDKKLGECTIEHMRSWH